MAKILDIQFDVNNQELLAFDEGKTIKFNVYQLREVKELFHRYDEATLIHNSEDEEEEFHYFCKKMAEMSPEAVDVASPYLN